MYRNKIKTFNISDLKSIEVFQGYNNQISEFITNNQANFYSNLKELQLQVNQISSLDISNCPIIEICNARENVITNFVTNPEPNYYKKLYELSLSYNQFFKIDISNMPSLKTCALGAKVQSNSPDIKRNTNFTQLITNSTPGYYYQISYLGFAYTAVSSVDLKGMETLNELYSNYSKLSSLDLSEHPNLTSLILDNNELATIHLSSSPGFYSKLYNLQLGYNKLTAIDISNLPVLKTAFLNNNKFITLDVCKNPLLEIFNAQYNQLTSFITNNEMDYYKKLHDFKISFNQLSRVNISNMPALVTCALGAKGVLSGNTYVRNENLKQIVTNPKEGYYYQITYLGFSDSEMSTIDLTGMENLKELNAPNCKISSLNLSNLNSLQKITITNNYLTFEDFEPIISKAIPTRIFFPQSSVNLFYNPSIYSFSVRVGGANNKYQWRKDGVNIAGATSPNYTISANDYNTNAQYQCVITNTIVTGLTLYSVIKRPQDSFTDLSSTFYISRASGNWNDNTTWQLFDGTRYIDAQSGELPGENNSVYLQGGHTVTLNSGASCKDLHLNTTADVIRLNTAENTLDVYGKIRSYKGPVPGVSSTSAGVPDWITTGTNGRIRLKGTTNRIITEKGEFSDHENLKGWTLECYLAEGVTGTINSNFGEET